MRLRPAVLLLGGLVIAALAAPATAAEPPASLTLRDAQAVLKAARYYIGPIDGQPGPMTRSALRQFQLDRIDRGLKPTGRLDGPTREALLDLIRQALEQQRQR